MQFQQDVANGYLDKIPPNSRDPHPVIAATREFYSARRDKRDYDNSFAYKF